MSSNTQAYILYSISSRSIILVSKVFGQCVPESILSPQSWTMNLATGKLELQHIVSNSLNRSIFSCKQFRSSSMINIFFGWEKGVGTLGLEGGLPQNIPRRGKIAVGTDRKKETKEEMRDLGGMHLRREVAGRCEKKGPMRDGSLIMLEFIVQPYAQSLTGGTKSKSPVRDYEFGYSAAI